MEMEVISPLRGEKETLWRDFLSLAGLHADGTAEQTVLLWDDDCLIATASRQGNLLKYIAVAEERQGEGLLAKVLTPLRQEAIRVGYRHLFLYTKPENRALFADLFFYPVAQTESVLLMEDKKKGIHTFLERLPVSPADGAVGAAVMNCDPFTLGHLHLIETAAAECAQLYVFVLSEEQSCFSAAERLELVKAGTAHLPNVTVLPTGPYLISQATFPTYFLKEREKAGEIQCQLDIEIFTRYFAPHFSITRRYVGTEPLSPLTCRYNEVLKNMLPRCGIEVREIFRLSRGETPVSASAVRKAWKEGDLDGIKELVPDTTWAFLKEKAGCISP